MPDAAHDRVPSRGGRLLLAGACLMASGLALAAGGFARLLPSESPLGPLMRQLDPLAPWFLALGASFSLWVRGGPVRF